MLLLLLERIHIPNSLITTRKDQEEWQKIIFSVYILCYLLFYF